MLTANINVDDRLVNGELGTVVETRKDSPGILNIIYVKFENRNPRLIKMRSDRCGSEKNIVPILRIEATFSVSLNLGLTIH